MSSRPAWGLRVWGARPTWLTLRPAGAATLRRPVALAQAVDALRRVARHEHHARSEVGRAALGLQAGRRDEEQLSRVHRAQRERPAGEQLDLEVARRHGLGGDERHGGARTAVVANQGAGQLIQPLGLEHLGQSSCGCLYGRRHRCGLDLVRVRVWVWVWVWVRVRVRVRVGVRVRVRAMARARARPPAPLRLDLQAERVVAPRGGGDDVLVGGRREGVTRGDQGD